MDISSFREPQLYAIYQQIYHYQSQRRQRQNVSARIALPQLCAAHRQSGILQAHTGHHLYDRSCSGNETPRAYESSRNSGWQRPIAHVG